MAIYGFWGDGEWLKIGKAGPNSGARYLSQHYKPGRAISSLPSSLAADMDFRQRAGFTDVDAIDWVEKWIRGQTSRFNVLVPADRPKALLALLEAFLHARLQPRYEG